MHVFGVELGQHRARDHLNVPDLQAREGDEDQGLDGRGLGEEYVREVHERDGSKEDKATEEAAGFDGDQHVVRKCAGGHQEGAVQVRGHGLVRPVLGAAFGDRFEVAKGSHDHGRERVRGERESEVWLV